MERPSPSRVTTLTTLASRSMRCENPNRDARPPPIAAMAPAIGMPAATNPPNTKNITMNDSGRAIPSPLRRSASIWWVIASMSGRTPPTAPVAPGNAATTASNCCCAAAWAAFRCGVSRPLAKAATVTNPPPAGVPPLEERGRLRVLQPPGQEER